MLLSQTMSSELCDPEGYAALNPDMTGFAVAIASEFWSPRRYLPLDPKLTDYRCNCQF